MASENLVQEFYDACKKVASYNVNELLTNPDWGAINFRQCENDILDGIKVAELWLNADYTILPNNTLKNILSAVLNFEHVLNSIHSYSINQDAEKQSTLLISQVSQFKEQLISTASNWLPFLQTFKSSTSPYIAELDRRLARIDFEVEKQEKQTQKSQKNEFDRTERLKETIEKANASLTSARQKSEDILNSAQSYSDKIIRRADEAATEVQSQTEKALQEARKLAAEKAVAPFTHSFKETANDWDGNAHGWLVTTGVLLIATGLWAYHGLQGSVPALNQTTEIVQYFSARFLITALLISSIWWSAKQYRVARHQKTVNQHKADALRSFEAFIEATNSPDVRDAVILQTSQTIFGQQSTGYLDGKEDSSFEQYTKIAQSINSAAHAITKNS
ncbi:hypothetical protein [Terasakiella pusilla]|uniref:hypothetical protein n=1 Tax=Terasakiella pusilla TaxID=64973 RepID=UPI003AA7D0D1